MTMNGFPFDHIEKGLIMSHSFGKSIFYDFEKSDNKINEAICWYSKTKFTKDVAFMLIK